jgi:hypothetical protein
MPFGIIDTKDDAPLAGTEYLIRDDSASSLPDVDLSQLKRVLYKAGRSRAISNTSMLTVLDCRALIPFWCLNHPMTTPTIPW